jgi:hypothetical protein
MEHGRVADLRDGELGPGGGLCAPTARRDDPMGRFPREALELDDDTAIQRLQQLVATGVATPKPTSRPYSHM